MKKQKTVIMLENIKENMLGEKHESLLDENKMLRELLKSALDENKKFCEDLELKQKEVDSYKKMNIEGKEEYGNLRKLYDGAKAERNEYFRMYSELLNENKDLKKSYENFVKAKNAQYLRKRKTSSQKDVDALNLKLEKARACISDLEAKNEFFYQESIHLKKRLDVYYSLHEGKNDVFDTVTGIVDELEKAFRVTFEFTEPSLKGMAELFRKEKAKMEYQYANIEYVDKMFDKIMKAEKSLKEKEEKFETNKKMVEELYPRFKSRKTKSDGREKRKAIFEAKTKCAPKIRVALLSVRLSGQNTSVVQTPFESCLNDAFLLKFPLKYHLKLIANSAEIRIFT